MSKIPVSVCIIAKNEERYIEECLKALMPYGFEIIVTDTGSTDRTKEIAGKYADKVLDFEWVDDFSAARNFCAAHAANNWILSLDCDEQVKSMDVRTLRIFMQKFPKNTGVIRLKNIVIKPDGTKGYGTDDVTRFYNRNHYTFDYPIHEQVCLKDVARRDEKVDCFLVPAEVIHYGYAISPEEMEEKQRRNLELLYHTVEKGTADGYTYFQIGQSEFILRNMEKSIDAYRKSVAICDNTDYAYVQILIESLAKAYAYLDRFPEALAILEKYKDACRTARYNFAYASVLMDSGQPLKAMMIYIKITMLDDAQTLGENLFHCYRHIIELYTEMGNTEMAELFRGKYNACLEENERVLNGDT